MKAHRKLAAVRAFPLLTAVLAVLALPPSTSLAQGGSRPIPCPTTLTLRFLGLTTFRHAGHAWDTNWSLRMPIKVGEAYYVPPGQPLRITSTDGQAVWKNPGIVVACMEYTVDLYVLEVHAEYWVKLFLGKVEEICPPTGSGAGSTAGTELIENSIYGDTFDPYASGDLDDSGGTDCQGGGGSPGSGTQYEPGDNTGGETVDWGTGIGNGGTSACGTAAVVEYVCIDIWNPETGTWDTWSCGYATAC